MSLVGDGEFDHPVLIENLRFWGWDYALRQPPPHLIHLRGKQAWQRIDSVTLVRGLSLWVGKVVLTKASPYPTQLATNLLYPQAALRRPQKAWL